MPVAQGLRASGEGAFRVDDPTIRDIEIEMIQLRRAMRAIWARYERLQGFQPTTCANIPAVPEPILLSEATKAARPELQRVELELYFVHQSVLAAVNNFTTLCAQGGAITGSVEQTYLDGWNNAANAQPVFDNIRHYLHELTGLVMSE
ncbi:MAG: hypothetical protein HC915_19255 [Anaerolineae bacterium]|nr:hypothetical protein [Anaerolineae bacterium]